MGKLELTGWFKKLLGDKNPGDSVPVTVSDSVCLRDVSFRHGDNTILKRISLILDEHRIGIIGDNGSGKSSLLKLLNGLYLPDEGEVSIFGYGSLEHREYLPALAGFIFQNPDHQIIFPTVLEEVAFGLEQLGVNNDEASDEALAFLKQYGMSDLADRPVQNLSEGQKQLVCILGVLIMNPGLLLLDEPFSSLDLPTRSRLLRLIDQRPERVIMVTHEPESLTDFDRVIWIHEGVVRQDGKPDEVIAEYRAYAEQRMDTDNWGRLP